MLRLFTILFNFDLNTLPTALSLFEAVYNGFNIYKEHCPGCKAKGCLKKHDKYLHSLVDYYNNSLHESQVEIYTVLCSSCGGTFAVLPDILVPHKSYSILFIMKVLKAYFFRKETVEALCSRFGISVSTLYVWKKRYLSHKTLNLGKLAKYFYPEDPHLSEPCNICFTPSLRDFFSRFGFSFLQFHNTT